MSSTTKGNLTGLASAGKTGLHTGADMAKKNWVGMMDAAKTNWTSIMDAGQAWKGDQSGSGVGSTGQEKGKQAMGQAMGSDSQRSEKGSGKMQKGQLSTAKRKKGNTGKDKLKVRVA